MIFLKKIDNLINNFMGRFYIFPQFLLRVTLGTAFIIHGYSKFPLPPQNLIKFFNFSPLLASMVSIFEILAGGLLIISGLFTNYIGSLLTRISGLIILVIMVCALNIAHRDWFITTKLFTSEQIFLLTIGMYFLVVGNKKIK
jgi:uncharacterized membrane protein YphA (DoxX/SURF4 family)|tara:strand:+ start:50 stop:475 length:426 start_codon:yes stop_codon:yes gene_type:complete